jgi:hypothetical protein
MKGFYIFKILYKEKYLFITEPISRTNAYAQTVFWFIVNMQIKKNRISHLHNCTVTVIAAHKSYLS